MIVRRVGETVGKILRSTRRYAIPFIRIYTRTFVSHKHNYTEGYIQIVKRDLQLTTPVAFRYIKGTDFVKLLTAAAFDVMSDHITIQEWRALKWESLCRTIIYIVEEEYQRTLTRIVESERPAFPINIDNYIIEDKIGDISTCAAVYRALRNEQLVALKAMFNFCCPDLENMLRFENFGAELITMSEKLPLHPNVIRINTHFISSNIPHSRTAAEDYPAVFEYGEEKTLYLEMPLYSSSLAEYLSKKKLKEEDVVYVLHQLSSAVHHIVSHGIVHRDIKLDNVLIKEEEDGLVVVLTDFGMAHDSLQVPNHPHGRKWGNPLLMPPEISVSEDPSCSLDYTRSDMWCVGSLVYELLGAPNPFSYLPSKSYNERDLPQLPTRNGVLQRLVARLLRVEPAERLTARQCVLITGVLVWLPHLIHSDNGLEEVARDLALLSWQTAVQGRHATSPTIQLLSFLQLAKASEICALIASL